MSRVKIWIRLLPPKELHNPANTLILDFKSPELWDKSYCLTHQVYGMVKAAPANKLVSLPHFCSHHFPDEF